MKKKNEKKTEQTKTQKHHNETSTTVRAEWQSVSCDAIRCNASNGWLYFFLLLSFFLSSLASTSSTRFHITLVKTIAVKTPSWTLLFKKKEGIATEIDRREKARKKNASSNRTNWLKKRKNERWIRSRRYLGFEEGKKKETQDEKGKYYVHTRLSDNWRGKNGMILMMMMMTKVERRRNEEN